MKLIGRQTIKSHQQEPAELLLNRIISRTYRNVGRLENEGLRESQQQALQFSSESNFGAANHLFGAGNGVERPSQRLIDFRTYMHHFGIFLFFRFRNAIGFCSEVTQLWREHKGAVS